MTTASLIGSWSTVPRTPCTTGSTSEDDSPQYAAGNEPLASWVVILERPTLASTDDPFDTAVAKALEKYGPMLRRLAES